MSEYRYLLFPQGNQPTTAEVAELQSHAPAFAGHFAFGTDRQSGRLAIAFEAGPFAHVLQNQAGFKALIRKWELRGATIVEHLGFVKDPHALRPVPSSQWSPVAPPAGSSTPHSGPVAIQEKMIAAKDLAAREALGRSLLEVQHTLEQHRTLERFATWVLPLLILIGSLLTISLGIYTYQRLASTDSERRQETIERVSANPMQETLDQDAATLSEEERPSAAEPSP